MVYTLNHRPSIMPLKKKVVKLFLQNALNCLSQKRAKLTLAYFTLSVSSVAWPFSGSDWRSPRFDADRGAFFT